MQDRREPPRPLPLTRPCGWPTTRPPTLSSGRTPEEELVERNPGKQQRSDSRARGDRNRGGDGFGGDGKNCGSGDHHHRRGSDGKTVGVATTTTTTRVTAVEAGEARQVLVVAQRCRWGNFNRSNRGRRRSSGGGNGGRRNGARGRSAWDGSSTSSR